MSRPDPKVVTPDLGKAQGPGWLRSRDGVELYCRWQFPPKPKAIIVIVHGAGEHSGRYEYLWQALHIDGYGVCAMDHRGFGRSGGARGDVVTFEAYVNDLEAFVRLVSQAHCNARLALFGHSMGTTVAARLARRRSVTLAALVLSSAPVKILKSPGPLLEALARTVAYWLPTLKVPIGLRYEALSSDPAVVRAAKGDPDNTRWVTLRWGAQMLDSQGTLSTDFQELNLPVLVLHGKEDSIADYASVAKICHSFVHPLSQFFGFDGMRHELHNESACKRSRACKALLRWLNRVLTQNSE